MHKPEQNFWLYFFLFSAIVIVFLFFCEDALHLGLAYSVGFRSLSVDWNGSGWFSEGVGDQMDVMEI